MKLGRKEIGIDKPTYFIADIASNHDGSYSHAERLIYLAAEAGADAVKLQNFKADTIVSDYGFKQLGSMGHQRDWEESVYDTYRRYETPVSWTIDLKRVADSVGIDYLTTPYDVEFLDALAPYVAAWKVGSGDITYRQMLLAMAAYEGKPIIIGTGASTIKEVERAVKWIGNRPIVLMQCNTNYDDSANNFPYINLRVLNEYFIRFCDTHNMQIGLSDHTPGHTTVLGAVAWGARVIEKHFTDDTTQAGPDHAFSMDPVSWRTMVDRTRELEQALGDGEKRVEDNEKESVVLQRRAIRARKAIAAGQDILEDDLVFLRPCPADALPPFQVARILGKAAQRDIPAGDYLREADCQPV